ncbi:MAG: hypothetical protein L6Q99_20420 [Planctomycetes bacterium]|nr:hypothetical protein [Planctomycetota bacterium]
MNPLPIPGLIALTLAGLASTTDFDHVARTEPLPAASQLAVGDTTPFALPLPPAGTISMQDPGDGSDWPPPGAPTDLEPIYFFRTECPNDLVLVNWTKCVLYFRTFLDCDGDGVVDSMNEHFSMPIDPKTGVPWVEHIQPKEDCDILYWGLFDIIPVGGCEPGWLQDPNFPCAVHFL